MAWVKAVCAKQGHNWRSRNTGVPLYLATYYSGACLLDFWGAKILTARFVSEDLNSKTFSKILIKKKCSRQQYHVSIITADAMWSIIAHQVPGQKCMWFISFTLMTWFRTITLLVLLTKKQAQKGEVMKDCLTRTSIQIYLIPEGMLLTIRLPASPQPSIILEHSSGHIKFLWFLSPSLELDRHVISSLS